MMPDGQISSITKQSTCILSDGNKKKIRKLQPVICNICYGEEVEKEKSENPLVNVCDCKGNMGVRHLKCIK